MFKQFLKPLACVLMFSAMVGSAYAASEVGTNPKARPPIDISDPGVTDPSQALADAIAPEIGYYDVTPDFTTNLASAGVGRLHYLRVHVNIMVKDSNDLELLSTHDALIRDAILNIIGSKEYGAIATAAGREALRSECRARVAELLEQKKNGPVVQDLLFTSYLYQ